MFHGEYQLLSTSSGHSFTAKNRQDWAGRSCHRSKLLTVVIALFCAAVITASLFGPGVDMPFKKLRYGGSPKSLMLVMADSRAPAIPNDPEEPIPFVSITTLINYNYAMEQGADFVFVLYDKPEVAGKPGANSPVCNHPRLGWRAAAWCKIPAMWHMVTSNPNTKHFMFIDSDAVFRNDSFPPSTHLDHLTPYRPIGFVSNQPWDSGVCTGYFFLRRNAVSFLKAWWDVDAPKANQKRLWEQDALNKLFVSGVPKNEVSLSNPSYWDRIVALQNERQFAVADPHQFIHHVSSEEKNRDEIIQRLWRTKGVSLHDRDALRSLLARVDIRRLNASAVALQMEHD